MSGTRFVRVENVKEGVLKAGDDVGCADLDLSPQPVPDFRGQRCVVSLSLSSLVLE